MSRPLIIDDLNGIDLLRLIPTFTNEGKVDELNVQQLLTSGMSLLADKNGITVRNPIKKIANGTYFGSYVITGTLSNRQKLYLHVNQGLAKIFRNWFPNENAFKSLKVMAKPVNQFKRFKIYGNPIGTIPKDSATTHPEITEGDCTNGFTPDNQRKIDITGNNRDGIICGPCPNDAFPNPSDDASSSSKNSR